MKKFPKNARQYLYGRQSDQIQPLVEYANYLSRLTNILRNNLSKPLADHLAIGNIQADSATILVDSSTWMSKARYMEAMILQILNSEGHNLKKLTFKVDPLHHQPPERKLEPAKMSSKTSKLLEDMADHTEHPALQEALRRLAKHGSDI